MNFDWTELQDSDQAMIVLGTQTEHGRSTPLVWKTVTRSALKDQRHAHEDERLGLFADVLPQGVRVTVVADRGFSDITLHRFLQELGFESIMRFRGVVFVESAEGLDDGQYGWCERCGNAIPVERLAAFPSATLCVTCKQLEERR